MTEQSEFVQFTHESKFDESKFDDYPFNKWFIGQIFTTCHKGIGYNWSIGICPNGTEFRTKLDNGEWSEWKEERNRVKYCLEFVNGPLSSVNAGFCLKVKPSNETAALLHHLDCLNRYRLFNKDTFKSRGGPIATKEELKRDGSLAGGFLTVKVEIKLNSELFNPYYILGKMKAGISEEQEKITPVPSVFFDFIDEEPLCGVSLKLVIGIARKNFFCIHQVLEQNSAYFRNLLRSNPEFKKNKISQFEFLDLDPEGTRAALRYIYLKELPDNFEEVSGVCLPAAHRFLLPGLVLECEKVMIKVLSAENDIEMAALAKTYDLTVLKSMALSSMALRYDDVMENAQTEQKLIDAHLLSEFFEVVACHARSGLGTVV